MSDEQEVSIEMSKEPVGTVDELLAKLPVDSLVTWTNASVANGEGKWTVRMGRNPNAQGEGKTLARAIQLVGAHWGPHPTILGKTVLLDQYGLPVAPEVTPERAQEA